MVWLANKRGLTRHDPVAGELPSGVGPFGQDVSRIPSPRPHQAARAATVVVISEVCRIAIGGMLIYSGVVKASKPEAFLATLYAFRILNHNPARVAAIMIPWLEAVFGICLVVNRFTLGALAGAVGLFAIFATALSVTLARGLSVECGCFGVSDNSSTAGLWTVARTSLFLVVSIWLLGRLIREASCNMAPVDTG